MTLGYNYSFCLMAGKSVKKANKLRGKALQIVPFL